MRLLIILLLLFSCAQKTQKNKYFVISKELKKNNSINDLYGNLQYGDYNIIMFGKYWVALHSKFSTEGDDDLIVENDKLLPFLDLKKDDFQIFKAYEILSYIQTNIKDSVYSFRTQRKRHTYVTIACDQDTINNLNFVFIKNQLIKQNVRFFYIRKITEEEKEVLNSIIKGYPYDVKKINWKTKFKPKLEPPSPEIISRLLQD